MGAQELPLSGQTGSFAKAGLAIGSTPAEIAIAAPNGAGVDFAINGIGYHKGDTASEAISAGSVQAVSTTCHYLILLNTDGNVSSIKGKEIATADIGVVAGTIQYPLPTDNLCPIGATKVVTGASNTFTAATDDHDGTGITTTYEDFIGGMPNRPTSS